jgi:hypothetical protein
MRIAAGADDMNGVKAMTMTMTVTVTMTKGGDIVKEDKVCVSRTLVTP